MRKLRPEILDIVGSEVSARGPDREDLKRMPYLANVVKEGKSINTCP